MFDGSECQPKSIVASSITAHPHLSATALINNGNVELAVTTDFYETTMTRGWFGNDLCGDKFSHLAITAPECKTTLQASVPWAELSGCGFSVDSGSDGEYVVVSSTVYAESIHEVSIMDGVSGQRKVKVSAPVTIKLPKRVAIGPESITVAAPAGVDLMVTGLEYVRADNTATLTFKTISTLALYRLSVSHSDGAVVAAVPSGEENGVSTGNNEVEWRVTLTPNQGECTLDGTISLGWCDTDTASCTAKYSATMTISNTDLCQDLDHTAAMSASLDVGTGPKEVDMPFPITASLTNTDSVGVSSISISKVALGTGTDVSTASTVFDASQGAVDASKGSFSADTSASSTSASGQVTISSQGTDFGGASSLSMNVWVWVEVRYTGQDRDAARESRMMLAPVKKQVSVVRQHAWSGAMSAKAGAVWGMVVLLALASVL